MFDASQMAQLAESYYAPHIQSISWSDPWDGLFIREMLEKLSNGSVLLVPYDVDKNHEPCLSGGKKAHWAAVKGFVVPLINQQQLDYCKKLSSTSERCSEESIAGLPIYQYDAPLSHPSLSQSSNYKPPELENTSSIVDLEMIVDFADPRLEQHLRLITQQSKSKHQGVWTYASLKDSNHNLMQFDEDRVTEPDFKVPAELSALRGKAVFLSPNPM